MTHDKDCPAHPEHRDRLAEIRDKSEYDINLFRKYWEKSGIDGGFWKEYSIATLLDMLDARDKELEQVKIITAEMDCTDWCGKSSKYDSAGELKFDSRCPKCKLTEIVQLVGSKE